ncbi:MAG TPA: hypothetical protein VJ810_22190 [Blastocatellia bacterium]|nr:hypothetical protein [Blastocatellia bacterium]
MSATQEDNSVTIEHQLHDADTLQDMPVLNNQSNVIEDLAAQNAEEIKGGPTPKSKRDLILKTSVADLDRAIGDLEPQVDVVGGQTREHILLARQVG